jgi:hypothetical protein
VLKIGGEKMKVSDEQNRQPLRDINPKEAFHRIGLAGMARIGQGAAVPALTSGIGTIPRHR